MRKYETFFIVDPDLPDEGIAVIDDKLKKIVTDRQGIVLSYVPWGKKKLAYPVKKRTRGHYILMEFAGDPTLVAELERNMRLDERVLKFITIVLEDRFDPEKEPVQQQPKKLSLFDETEAAEEKSLESFDEEDEDEDEEDEDSEDEDEDEDEDDDDDDEDEDEENERK